MPVKHCTLAWVSPHLTLAFTVLTFTSCLPVATQPAPTALTVTHCFRALAFVDPSALSSWSEFSEQALKKYGVDMSGLDQAYGDECVGFFSLTGLWRELSGRQVVSEPTTVKGERGQSKSQTFWFWFWFW